VPSGSVALEQLGGERHGPVERPVSDELGEGVRRGGEDGDRIGAGGLGPGEAAEIRDEDRIADAGTAGKRREELVCVGQLRDGGRGDE